MTAATFTEARGTHPPLRRTDGTTCDQPRPCRIQDVVGVRVHDRGCSIYDAWWRDHDRLTDYIREVVDTAPPLTEQQRSKLAALLVGGGVA